MIAIIKTIITFDIKSVMNLELKNFYIETVELFDSNTSISKHVSADNIIRDEFEFLFRDVRFFVQHIKLVIFQHDFNVY